MQKGAVMIMSRRILSFNESTPAFTGLYGGDIYCDNKCDINNMKKLISTAISIELTEKQRYCITEFYYNNRKMKDIAVELNVAPSTVSRHIERGMKKLKRAACYYSRFSS